MSDKQRSPNIRSRKEARSLTSPSNGSPSPEQHRQSAESPARNNYTSEASPFKLDLLNFADPEDVIYNLKTRLEYFKQQNLDLQEQLLAGRTLPVSQDFQSLEDLISKPKCESCGALHLSQARSIALLKEENSQLLKSFYVLHRHVQPEEEDSKLLEVEQARKVTELVSNFEAEKEILKQKYDEETQSLQLRLKSLETGVRNLIPALREQGLGQYVKVSECEECLNKEKLIETLSSRAEEGPSIRLFDSYVYPPSKHLEALKSLAEDLERSLNDPLMRRKTESLKSTVTSILNAKPSKLSSARGIRTQIHQQVVQIEHALESIPAPSVDILDIKQEFKKLPFLLKPLFDLTKSYETEVPVLVSEAVSSSDGVHRFLCKIAEKTGGVLSVEDIKMLIMNYQEAMAELRDTKSRLARLESMANWQT